MRQRVTEPDCGESDEQLAEGVEGRRSGVSAADQREGIQSERRERREAAEDANDDEGSCCVAELQARRRRQAGERPDGQAADNVDEENSERKVGAEPSLHRLIREVAEERAGTAADRDRQ